MKISTLLILLSIFALTSCTPTMKPIQNAKSVDNTTPIIAPQPMAENSKLVEGKNIFTASCAKCHDLPQPKEFNDEDWIDLVKRMSVKAKLDENQEKLVYDYITSEN